MNIFNQQGQRVKNQINAGDIHLGNTHTSELTVHIQQLIQKVEQALADRVLTPDQAEGIKKELQNITTQANAPGKKKSRLLKHLKKAEDILKGVAAAGSITESLKQLGKAIANWLP